MIRYFFVISFTRSGRKSSLLGEKGYLKPAASKQCSNARLLLLAPSRSLHPGSEAALRHAAVVDLLNLMNHWFTAYVILECGSLQDEKAKYDCKDSVISSAERLLPFWLNIKAVTAFSGPHLRLNPSPRWLLHDHSVASISSCRPFFSGTPAIIPAIITIEYRQIFEQKKGTEIANIHLQN